MRPTQSPTPTTGISWLEGSSSAHPSASCPDLPHHGHAVTEGYPDEIGASSRCDPQVRGTFFTKQT
jgi:hypothetical protein